MPIDQSVVNEGARPHVVGPVAALVTGVGRIGPRHASCGFFVALLAFPASRAEAQSRPQRSHAFEQHRLVISLAPYMTLGRAVVSRHVASPAFGTANDSSNCITDVVAWGFETSLRQLPAHLFVQHRLRHPTDLCLVSA